MCGIIAQWLKSTPDAYGRINWQDISLLLTQKLSETNHGRSISYSDVDCHKQWRLLAYGERHGSDDIITNCQRKFQHTEDSDEVTLTAVISFSDNRNKHTQVTISASFKVIFNTLTLPSR